MAGGKSAAPLSRCAVYTRKSSEDGLEQNFNSLDAQREACEAYILSQKAEGWRVVPEFYDDGGLSGGTMERPALHRLLKDIESGEIDTVVVYKVDRLTRSLRDFAKIVDAFDARNVSFVSVTQAFNTTTSMGRLTLNMLLSFAQFEREVTSERIRDKIAASKKKGLWMGGVPPLGYDVKDKALVVNAAEAVTVRRIYQLYQELGSVRALKDRLDRDGVVSKRRINRHGRLTGGQPLARGALYLMLQNPLYCGCVAHKGEAYPGKHQAIIDDALWRNVQETLAANRVERTNQTTARHPSLLTGLLYDAAGDAMSPTHANKKGRRYRYYVSQSLIKRGRPKASDAARRLPARDIEHLIETRVKALLSSPDELHAAIAGFSLDAHDMETVVDNAAKLADSWPGLSPSDKRGILRQLIIRITIMPDEIKLMIRVEGLMALEHSKNDALTTNRPFGPNGPGFLLTIPAELKRTGIEKKLILNGAGENTFEKPDPVLLALIAKAQKAQSLLVAGEQPVSAMAAALGHSPSYFTKLVRLSFLAPDITTAILKGRQPKTLTARQLMADTRLPLCWDDQRKALGF